MIKKDLNTLAIVSSLFLVLTLSGCGLKNADTNTEEKTQDDIATTSAEKAIIDKEDMATTSSPEKNLDTATSSDKEAIDSNTATSSKKIKSAAGIDAKEFTMTSFTEMKDGKYFPQYSIKELTVKKGELVRIKITNIKGTHDFKIDELNVYEKTPLNQEVTIEFTPDKAGKFEYYCTQPGHRANGHWGTLIVTE